MIGSLGFNPHVPGPIGDTTPGTIAATTLSATSTAAPQVVAAYDINNELQLSVASNGNPTFNMVASSWNNWVWNVNGSGIVNWNAGTSMQLLGAGGNYGFNGAVTGTTRVHYALPGGAGFGGYDTNKAAVLPNGAATMIWSASTVQIASGIVLQFGNAGTGSLTPGAFAATTNATMVLGTDTNGKVITVPCTLT